MSNDWLDVSLLTDRKLDERLRELAHGERGITAELLAHLAEVDARRLCGGMAECSTFNHCGRVLKFTEDEACKRIRVARTAREYPVIYDLVARGELGQTAVSRLAPLLTMENHGELLEAARGKPFATSSSSSRSASPSRMRPPSSASCLAAGPRERGTGAASSPPAPRAEARAPRVSRPGELPTMKAGARADRRSRR